MPYRGLPALKPRKVPNLGVSSRYERKVDAGPWEKIPDREPPFSEQYSVPHQKTWACEVEPPKRR